MIATAEQILERVSDLGIRIRVEGGDLKIKAKPSRIAPFVDDLKTHKAEIIRLLTPKPEPNKQLVCYSCRGKDFWTSIYGVSVCRKCHPPVADAEVSR
jgi:hypothetical protein